MFVFKNLENAFQILKIILNAEFSTSVHKNAQALINIFSAASETFLPSLSFLHLGVPVIELKVSLSLLLQLLL